MQTSKNSSSKLTFGTCAIPDLRNGCSGFSCASPVLEGGARTSATATASKPGPMAVATRGNSATTTATATASSPGPMAAATRESGATASATVTASSPENCGDTIHNPQTE